MPSVLCWLGDGIRTIKTFASKPLGMAVVVGISQSTMWAMPHA